MRTPPLNYSRLLYLKHHFGINEALDFVQDAVTELTTEKGSFELPSNTLCKEINTRPTLPSTISY